MKSLSRPLVPFSHLDCYFLYMFLSFLCVCVWMRLSSFLSTDSVDRFPPSPESSALVVCTWIVANLHGSPGSKKDESGSEREREREEVCSASLLIGPGGLSRCAVHSCSAPIRTCQASHPRAACTDTRVYSIRAGIYTRICILYVTSDVNGTHQADIRLEMRSTEGVGSVSPTSRYESRTRAPGAGRVFVNHAAFITTMDAAFVG